VQVAGSAVVTTVHEEYVAIVDRSGQVVGSASRSVMRRDNLPHLVVAVLLQDSSGRVYVHRRTDTKDVFPGRHDCFSAGCVQAGEEPGAAAERELAEELGVSGVALEPLATGWYEDESTRHLWHGYLATYDGKVVHQADEIAWGGWMTLDDLRAHLADPQWPFVPDGRALLEELLATGRLG
jgi:8-oxo-dGTP pyrophosphatase MutT (NUDIX family)